jgi:hypothetical protein
LKENCKDNKEEIMTARDDFSQFQEKFEAFEQDIRQDVG